MSRNKQKELHSSLSPMTEGLSDACADCEVLKAARMKKLGIALSQWDFVVALTGPPNTGKSTVFNRLTGLRQHTGNWPGKTVSRAEGAILYGDKRYKIVDLPGTYSLLSTSYDEEIARDFVLFGQPDVTVVVLDATRLESNLNLLLQILEITDRVVVCLNLVDEAARRGLKVDERRLARDLGVPVLPTSARYNNGLDKLVEVIAEIAARKVTSKTYSVAIESPVLQSAIEQMVSCLQQTYPELPNARWVAWRLLDGDPRIIQAIRHGELGLIPSLEKESEQRTQALSQEGRRKRAYSQEGRQTEAFSQEGRQTEAFSQEGRQTGVYSQGDRVTGELDFPMDPKAESVLAEMTRLRQQLPEHFHDRLVEYLFADSARLAERSVHRDTESQRFDWERTVDRIVTSRRWGIPIMLLLFTLVLWLTIAGANIPSAWLSQLLIGKLYPWLKQGAVAIGFPWWLHGVLIDGMYLATAWVVSVMLPPMAIFFPLFSLLEDLGYLPRVAFNLDSTFHKVGAHGKQALSMMMGFGCNAAGVIATRVIDSPRERLLAILTNNFSLCNGRWPTQILIATIFVGVLVPSYLSGLVATLAVVGVAMLGVFLTFGVSWLLSRTMLRGEVSSFSLELPPYRPPRIMQTLYTSLIDRTIFVLWRAIVFALPAGAAIWLLSNVHIGTQSLAEHAIHWMNPLGLVLGLNGVILLAYIVAIPANEIVIPTVLMLTVLVTNVQGVGAGAGVIFEPQVHSTLAVLQAGGWTLLTAVNLMLFSLIHNPCSTTIYTVYKETGSTRWTLVASLLPLLMGFFVTFLVAQIWQFFL